MAQFFEIRYIGIFKRFLIAESNKEKLFGLMSTYYGMVKRNS